MSAHFPVLQFLRSSSCSCPRVSEHTELVCGMLGVPTVEVDNERAAQQDCGLVDVMVFVAETISPCSP
jgi:hypothetical protein